MLALVDLNSVTLLNDRLFICLTGTDFSVRDFHQEVLKCGAVPLTLLETIIDNYIARGKAS